ncbi:hypothetical protein CPV28_20195 [Salmonella enterica]|nr:hypothetical protein [Salmonella enterica]
MNMNMNMNMNKISVLLGILAISIGSVHVAVAAEPVGTPVTSETTLTIADAPTVAHSLTAVTGLTAGNYPIYTLYANGTVSSSCLTCRYAIKYTDSVGIPDPNKAYRSYRGKNSTATIKTLMQDGNGGKLNPDTTTGWALLPAGSSVSYKLVKPDNGPIMADQYVISLDAVFYNL